MIQNARIPSKTSNMKCIYTKSVFKNFILEKVALKMQLFLFIPTWLVFSSPLRMVCMSNED